MPVQDIYHADLAQIHIDGYGFHWEGAAQGVLNVLRQAGVNDGTVVDLGCGGGQWLALLEAEGYDTYGVDASRSMIQAARKRAPKAKFLLGSMADVELPSCDAVTALGEPVNYLDGKRSIKRTFRHVYQALRPGGLFVFDAMHPAVSDVESRTAARSDDTWACIAVIEEDRTNNSLVRQITAFRKVGSQYRRSDETHRLKIYSKQEMISWLREIGFRVRTRSAYGDYKLRDRQSVFIARK